MGYDGDSGYSEPFGSELFPVQLTAVHTDSLGRPVYAFTEQSFDTDTAEYVDADSPRQGDGQSVNLLYEVNDTVVETPAYVWCRLRGVVQGQPAYEFQCGCTGSPTPTPSSSSSPSPSSSSSHTSQSSSPSPSSSDTSQSSQGGCSASFYETDVRCELGILNVYRRELTLSLVNGCPAIGTGAWFWYANAGCCDCSNSSFNSNSSFSFGSFGSLNSGNTCLSPCNCSWAGGRPPLTMTLTITNTSNCACLAGAYTLTNFGWPCGSTWQLSTTVCGQSTTIAVSCASTGPQWTLSIPSCGVFGSPGFSGTCSSPFMTWSGITVSGACCNGTISATLS